MREICLYTTELPAPVEMQGNEKATVSGSHHAKRAQAHKAAWPDVSFSLVSYNYAARPVSITIYPPHNQTPAA